MEVETFINQFIVQELTMNVDGNMRLSTYFAKDKDTKLFMPMVWDFDLALGNCTYIGSDFDLPYIDGSRNGPKGWFVKIRGGYPGENKGKKDTYYQYLFQDPQFVQALKDRWNTVKPRLDKIPAFIDKMAEYDGLVSLFSTGVWGTDLDYCDTKRCALETNQDCSLVFKVAP